MSICCANCCNNVDQLYFELSSSSLSWTEDEDIDDQGQKVNLKVAFCTVFEHGIELNKIKSNSDTEKEEGDHEVFGMCLECNTALAALYQAYIQFMRLTNRCSAVRCMIAKSKIWEVNKHDQILQHDLNHQIDNNVYDDLETFVNVNFDADENELENSFVIKEEVEQFDEEATVPLHINCFSVPPESDPPLISTSKTNKSPIVLIQKLTPKDIESEINKIKSSPRSSKSRSNSKTKSKSKTITKKKYSCHSCTKVFSSLLQLKYHESSTVHNEAKPKSKTETNNRTKYHSKPNPVEIPTIQKKKRKVSSLHEGQIIYNCTSCPASFPNFYKYRKHRRLFHASSIRKTFPCPECSTPPALFFKSGDLAWHLVTVHNIGSKLPGQQCPSCPMYFPSGHRMRAHLRSQHLNKGKFACSVEDCKATASSPAALRVHVRLVHQTTAKAHMCEVCGATYKSESGLKLHVRLNHVENPPRFTCDICSKSCTTSTGLKGHMARVHTEGGRVRNVACEQCPKLFYDIMELKKHKRNVHTGLGPKPHACETCGARFAQKVGLRHHYLANHAEGYGPFPCPICGKEFKAKDNLKQHLNTKVHGEEGKLLLKQQRSDQKQPPKQVNASSTTLFVHSNEEERHQAEKEMEFHQL